MQILELKVPPVAVVVAFAFIMWIAAVFLSPASIIFPGASILALAFIFLGGGIAVAGVSAFRRHETTVNPLKPDTASSIVTAGIYRVTRNPMYLGLTFALLAWAMCLANPVSLLLVPAFVAYMTRFQIIPEERALSAKFGSGFTDYMAMVRRWI